MAAVELEGLTKVFGNGVCAVDGLSLSVHAGELLVLVGASGSGKTTVLRLIAGLEQPTAGSIRLAGRDVTAVPPWQRDVALVFQQPALYPHLTVAANLTFSVEQRQPGLLQRWAARLLQPRRWQTFRAQQAELARRLVDVAGLLGITPLLGRLPAQLSGGEQQRVALGRALVRQPEVLLLDEPFSHLDTRLRQELRGELLLLHRRLATTILFVTHDPQEALNLGDRVAVLHRGMLQQVAEPQRLYEQPASRFVAHFLGWPEQNFLDGVLLFERDKLYFVGGDVRWPVPPERTAAWSAWVGRPVTLGVPPEAVGVGAEIGHPVEMDVVQLEGWGPMALVTWQAQGLRLRGRGSAQTIVQGQRHMVRLRLETAHLFDAATGQAPAGGRSTA